MTRLHYVALLSAVAVSHAFVQPKYAQQPQSKSSSTELFVIGPMLRKMREEKAKKKMPMASEDEASKEAPGLRVGSNAWKWPPVWPYGKYDFTPKEDIKEDAQPEPANPLSNLMGGATSTPPPPPVEAEDKEEDTTLDIMAYWGEEKATVYTEIDDEASSKLKEHYGFYLKDGQTVLELGAAEESYLPEGVKLERHVGVGANKALMEKNPALSESIVADLNDVVEEDGVRSNELRSLGANSFDVILMANTIDFLTNPREVFRTSWQLLKPGGTMIVSFVNREAYNSKFERAQTKMWRDMNDDQHMWICGSFFQFSAGDGWDGLKGFDITPLSAKKKEGIMAALDQNKGMNMFVVQATKKSQDEEINEADPETSFKSKMWLFPTLEERDKLLIAPRLARTYKIVDEKKQKAMSSNLDSLPKVYESLVKMDQFAFTFSMQAQLAADLVYDEDFEGNDEQIIALKMGLGLRTPSKDFWEPVGQQTFNMEPEDKINLLTHVVPRFGSGNPEQEAALQNFVSGFQPTFEVIKSKCNSMSEADVQLLGTELLAAEILKPGRSTKEQFAAWLGSITESELNDILVRRKSFKTEAVTEMKVMQVERKAEAERIEALREKMKKQQEDARKERSMAFNPETGKMETVETKE